MSKKRLASDEPSFSIIVITYNRAKYLASCLRRLEFQDYSNFEVIVVNGPSTDETEGVLQLFPRARVCLADAGNVSRSRNVALRAAEGELVAFIDDDALACRDWLKQLSRSFEQTTVGGAGGLVYGIDPRRVDFSNGTVDRFGRVVPLRSRQGTYNDKNGSTFNTVMGTNCGFRRSALFQIGLFDEVFDYYHDEADVCTRLIGAGWQIAHNPAARVVHLSASGPERPSRFDLNWHTVLKNTVYFSLKNGPPQRGKRVHAWRALTVICRSRFLEFSRWLISGRVMPGLYAKILRRAFSGVRAGWEQSRLSQAAGAVMLMRKGGRIYPYRRT